MGEKNDLDLQLDEVRTPITMQEKKQTKVIKRVTEPSEPQELISCLRNEKAIVRYLPRESNMVKNPKHIFYGGMAETAVRTFTVPIMESTGTFVNVLTNSEKIFLEEMMGLDANALSIYLKENNFWVNYNVRLTKGDTYLDLSTPEDYIKYKVLLTHKDYIASSLTEMQEHPKATYQFVIISENEESNNTNKQLNASMEAYMVLGKIQEEKELLKYIVETISGRPISNKAKLDFITGEVYKIIQSNAKMFINVAKDPLLETKVLINKGTEMGIIRKRSDYYYLASDNSPLCEINEDPTINIAAKYLNAPKHQEIKFTIEAKIKALKD